MPLQSPVLLDTTVLSNFASSESVGSISATIEQPATVPAVRDELTAGIEHGHSYLETALSELGNGITVLGRVPDDEPLLTLRERLDPGEAEALATAIVRDGSLASDDLAAREVATDCGVQVTGSVGILVLGIRRDAFSVETANEWLETWRSVRGYYAPVEDILELV